MASDVVTSKKHRGHPHFSDIITVVLYTWGPGRLAHLLGVLKACLTLLSVQHHECDTTFASHNPPCVVPTPTGILPINLLGALDYLSNELKTIQDDDDDWNQRLSDAARALFIVLFMRDGRVRRLVMTPHAGHSIWKTMPPGEARLKRFLEQDANGTTDGYLTAMANPTLTPEAACVETASFVRFFASWWICSTPVAGAFEAHMDASTAPQKESVF